MDETPHSHTAELSDALDFLNTLEFDRGEPNDTLATAGDALAWLHEHGLVHHEVLHNATDADALGRVRRTRAALRELADATYEKRPPSSSAIAEVNRVLKANEVLEIVLADDGLRLNHRHAADPLDDALGRLAEPIVREIADGQPDRLRACADRGCRWIFFDGSRTGRRRWCDMATCGNRAKAERHRARIRTAPKAPDG